MLFASFHVTLSSIFMFVKYCKSLNRSHGIAFDSRIDVAHYYLHLWLNLYSKPGFFLRIYAIMVGISTFCIKVNYIQGVKLLSDCDLLIYIALF